MMAVPQASPVKEIKLDPCLVCGSTKLHVGYSRIFRLCHSCAAPLLSALHDPEQRCVVCQMMTPDKLTPTPK